MVKDITPTDIFKATLQLVLKSRDQWTHCCYFRCVMNTGWAAGDDKYLCRVGLCVETCDAVNKIQKQVIVKA